MNSQTITTFSKKALGRINHEIRWREHIWRPVGQPKYHPNTPHVAESSFEKEDGMRDWYSPVLLSPEAIGDFATSSPCLRQTMQIMQKLEADNYTKYLLAYYETGLSRFGDKWRYADISTALLAASQLLKPQNYLEIGVRRGRSMAMVAATSPNCHIIGFDMWVENYAGMDNPGLEFVRQELAKVGYTGKAEFINGDSHKTIKKYFKTHPNQYFDLITVDGDHSNRGASLDLRDVLPYLKVGGVVVFDDISQPNIEYLRNVWHRYVGGQMRFASWEFGELGYGIAIGIRKF